MSHSCASQLSEGAVRLSGDEVYAMDGSASLIGNVRSHLVCELDIESIDKFPSLDG